MFDLDGIVISGADEVNGSNKLNVTMFKLATEVYDMTVDQTSPETLKDSYILEVLKLLQTMQGEMATFSRSQTQVLMRSLGDIFAMSSYIRQEVTTVPDYFPDHKATLESLL